MPWLVCYYKDGGVSREWVDDEFDEEDLFLTAMHRGATRCDLEEEEW